MSLWNARVYKFRIVRDTGRGYNPKVPDNRKEAVRMDHVFKQSSADEQVAERQLSLGPLELEVMNVIWANGTSSVRDVAKRIRRELAYTTVMTTLDRLYKKNVLSREMSDRAFLYSASFTREEWERRRAGEMVAGFLTGSAASQHVLLSCLVDAVGSHDAMLLDELESKIQRKKEELARTKEA